MGRFISTRVFFRFDIDRPFRDVPLYHRAKTPPFRYNSFTCSFERGIHLLRLLAG